MGRPGGRRGACPGAGGFLRPGLSSPKARQVSLFLPRRKSIVRGSFELLCDRLRSFFRVLVDKFAIRRAPGEKLPISARGGALPGPPGGALHPAKVCPGPPGALLHPAKVLWPPGADGADFARRKCCGYPGLLGRTLPGESPNLGRPGTLRHSALLKSTRPLGRRTFALCHGKVCGRATLWHSASLKSAGQVCSPCCARQKGAQGDLNPSVCLAGTAPE